MISRKAPAVIQLEEDVWHLDWNKIKKAFAFPSDSDFEIQLLSTGGYGCVFALRLRDTPAKERNVLVVKLLRDPVPDRSESFSAQLYKEVYLQQFLYYASPRGVPQSLGVQKLTQLPLSLAIAAAEKCTGWKKGDSAQMSSSSFSFASSSSSSSSLSSSPESSAFWVVGMADASLGTLEGFMETISPDNMLQTELYVMLFEVLYHLSLFENIIGFQHRQIRPSKILVDLRENFGLPIASKWKLQGEGERGEEKEKEKEKEKEDKIRGKSQSQDESQPPAGFSSEFKVETKIWTIPGKYTYLISDFGLAWADIPHLPEPPSSPLRDSYYLCPLLSLLAPEMWHEIQCVDAWALGIVFIGVLCGRFDWPVSLLNVTLAALKETEVKQKEDLTQLLFYVLVQAILDPRLRKSPKVRLREKLNQSKLLASEYRPKQLSSKAAFFWGEEFEKIASRVLLDTQVGDECRRITAKIFHEKNSNTLARDLLGLLCSWDPVRSNISYAQLLNHRIFGFKFQSRLIKEEPKRLEKEPETHPPAPPLPTPPPPPAPSSGSLPLPPLGNLGNLGNLGAKGEVIKADSSLTPMPLSVLNLDQKAKEDTAMILGETPTLQNPTISDLAKSLVNPTFTLPLPSSEPERQPGTQDTKASAAPEPLPLQVRGTGGKEPPTPTAKEPEPEPKPMPVPMPTPTPPSKGRETKETKETKEPKDTKATKPPRKPLKLNLLGGPPTGPTLDESAKIWQAVDQRPDIAAKNKALSLSWREGKEAAGKERRIKLVPFLCDTSLSAMPSLPLSLLPPVESQALKELRESKVKPEADVDLPENFSNAFQVLWDAYISFVEQEKWDTGRGEGGEGREGGREGRRERSKDKDKDSQERMIENFQEFLEKLANWIFCNKAMFPVLERQHFFIARTSNEVSAEWYVNLFSPSYQMGTLRILQDGIEEEGPDGLVDWLLADSMAKGQDWQNLILIFHGTNMPTWGKRAVASRENFREGKHKNVKYWFCPASKVQKVLTESQKGFPWEAAEKNGERMAFFNVVFGAENLADDPKAPSRKDLMCLATLSRNISVYKLLFVYLQQGPAKAIKILDLLGSLRFFSQTSTSPPTLKQLGLLLPLLSDWFSWNFILPKEKFGEKDNHFLVLSPLFPLFSPPSSRRI